MVFIAAQGIELKWAMRSGLLTPQNTTKCDVHKVLTG
nr:DUF4113 domain-containing protein [Shewanella xiamenensis]